MNTAESVRIMSETTQGTLQHIDTQWRACLSCIGYGTLTDTREIDNQ